MKTQHEAKLRCCARCEKVFWNNNNGCPVCDFAHYGAIWALGWRHAIWNWLSGVHRYENPNPKTR